MTTANIAINRFGLGARPGDHAPNDPKAWLTGQLDRFVAKPPAIAAAPGSAAVAAHLADYYAERRALRQQYGPLKQLRQRPPAGQTAMVDPTKTGTPQAYTPQAAPGYVAGGTTSAMSGAAATPESQGAELMRQARREGVQENRQDYAGLVGARATQALITDTPFVERLVHFWANHFTVSADKLGTVGLAGTLEMEAIRPHVLGKFSDMLSAVEHHPAMLLYLDQAVSVGPNSEVGQRIAARGNRKVGLNENLAREIMELHTLGVRTGYTQADVTEFARAMTGWTVAGIGNGPAARLDGGDGTPGSFVFRPQLHEPGDRTIVGKRYAENGEKQAQAVLNDLAASPATATHLATKLARHFAGDTPPPAMVARLQAAYLKSGGDLPAVYRAIIASPEAWVEQPVKFKTPWEWSISTMRALGMSQVQPLAMVGLMNQLGQPVWKPGQPVGYDDIAGSWAGPDAVMRRVEAANRFATRAQETDARALSQTLFPGSVSAATTQSLIRAESPGQALALLLVSPEMMRR